MKRIHDRERGYTLVELLVVLAIMTLLLTLTLPGTLARSSSVELRLAVTAFSNAARTARRKAVTRGVDQAIALDVDGHAILLAPEMQRMAISSHINVRMNAARTRGPTEARIVFFADGTSTGGRISLSADGHEVTLFVDWLTGGISVRGGRA